MDSPLDIDSLLGAEGIAKEVGRKFTHFNTLRSAWLEEKKELRNYVFATDTKTTANQKLPWSNSTTTPKLTQIYDNLKANYVAALFPNRNWHRWEADDGESGTTAKKEIIQSYMQNKLTQSGFEETIDTLVDDYILYGNCFATVSFEVQVTEVEEESVPNYVGPSLVRISPYDIVFDPTSTSFNKSAKVIRSLVSLGDLKKRLDNGETQYQEVFNKVTANRREVGSAVSVEKSDGYVADGFSTIETYYSSDYVELLTFYGDLFDAETGNLLLNRKIEVVDRAYVVYNKPIASWLGSAPVFHAGWRSRPDNLYAMGPLDNLVGMQYRIDHLENLKADVFDQIALPTLKIRGDVEEFTYGPAERIYIGDEGDVSYLVPDATALNADFQIQALENKMEEMAGAPRQAMGIRTPGEKTAFEVQTLQNSASRIFQHKASKFEREFIEPILNSMLESARRNLDESDIIRVLSSDEGVETFKEITKADITAKGKIVPVGARHFAERAQRIQNLNQMLSLKSDPTIGVHMSGKEIARIIATELGEEKIFAENIAIKEQAATQTKATDTEAAMMEEQMIKAETGL